MHRFLIIIRLFPFCLLLLISMISTAQTSVHPIADWLESYRPGGDFKSVELLSPQPDQNRSDRPALENATLLHLDHTRLDALLKAAPTTLRLRVPNAYGADFDLELVRVDILSEGFSVGTLGTHAQQKVDYQKSAHYRGILLGDPASVVAISLTTDGLMGMITHATGTYTVGQMEDGSGDYLLYRREDLPVSAPHQCFNDEAAGLDFSDNSTLHDRGVGCRTVQIYFECDYKLYQDKGSSASGATNYVTSLFNQVAALYANENVGVAISEIYVWTSPDPYASMNSTSSVLNAFRSGRGTNFNGNLAHFLSTRNLGGGIAYVDVICLKSYAFGVSAIYTSFQNVPTYSWSVEVLTHELGHNLGSWHTQSCNWTGGALDNCVSPEGSCAPGPPPSNGGTIMSYCHLSNYGINFANGFGTQPGNKIRERVTAATCAPLSANAPTNLTTSNITGSSATLNWGAVTGATNYTVQYKLSTSSAWTLLSSTTSTSYNLTGLIANATYDWQVKTDCSNFSVAANFSTTSSGGATCAPPLGLNASAITTSSVTLGWTAVSGAASYSIQFKTSATSVWSNAGTTAATNFNLNNLTANTAYNWQVKANCSTWSATAGFSTANTGSGSCAAPTGLGTSNLSNTSVTLNWSAVSGATSYTIQFKTAAASLWNTAGTSAGASFGLSNLTANTAYNWRVKASCSAYSVSANFTTTNSGAGACNAPSTLITSQISASSATLTWSAVSGATSYTLQFKTSLSQFWSTAGTTATTTYSVGGLASSTSYDWRIKANCSGYSATATFVTSSGGGSLQCDAPATLVNNSIGSTWAVISWSPSPGATSYTLQIKLANSSTYTTLGTVGSTQVTLSGMQPATSYNWRVKANCSFYSTSMYLTTTANLPTPYPSGLPEIASCSVFPNPATTALNVRFSGSILPDAEWVVYDATGRAMLHEPMLLSQQQVDITRLPSGLYFMWLQQGGQRVAVQRFVKQ